ncbi:MAG: hypothetical protein AAFX80_13445 [Cyanobacteria bacterium J06639_18]
MKKELRTALRQIDTLCEQIEKIASPYIRDNFNEKDKILVIDEQCAQLAFSALLFSSKFKEIKSEFEEFMAGNNPNWNELFINDLVRINSSKTSSLEIYKESANPIDDSIKESLEVVEESIRVELEIIDMIANQLGLEKNT